MRAQSSFYAPTAPDPLHPYSDAALCSYENTVLFWVGNFQYLTACVAFSVSRPFRLPVYTNTAFIVSLVLMIVFSTMLVLWDHPWLLSVFVLREDRIPFRFRLAVLILIVGNFAVSMLAEKWAVYSLARWW